MELFLVQTHEVENKSAERISARQYKSGSILGIMYVRTSQARTSRRSLHRRRRLDVYARARIQYRLGACDSI